MTFVLFVLIAWLAWCVWKLWTRAQALEQELRNTQENAASNAQLLALEARLAALEHRASPAQERPAAKPQPDAAPAAEPDLVDEPVFAAPPAFVDEQAPAPPRSEPPPRHFEWTRPSPPPLPRIAPKPEFAGRLRAFLTNHEWEMLLGGNVLNKLGALVLVIGIALFLGYSFNHVTRTGRAIIAIAVSFTLLGAGVRLEERGRFRIFAQGLIGAGWAALYATSYVIYAVPEARIIRDPFIGSIGVVAVAIGMILHSLRYRTQAITGLAYFAAFTAMAVTPSSPFAVISLIPLGASLLYLAWRFDWHFMALFGLVATYLTCLSRGSSAEPLAATQSLFLTYWLLFEMFDLLRVKRRLIASGLDLLFPLNAIGFLGLSYMAWAANDSARLWWASACGAALFLADSLVRAMVRPPASFAEKADLPTRLRAGSYEGAFLISSLLAGLAVMGRAPGIWAAVGVASEAEIVYLAGVRLRSTFLRRLGARAFALSLFEIFFKNTAQPRTFLLGSHVTHASSPPLLFHAALFYLNRFLHRPNVIMSSCAAALIAVVLIAELDISILGMVLILFGLILLEIGLRRGLMEFLAQSWFVLAAGVVATAAGMAHSVNWTPQAISLALVYGCAVRTKWMRELPSKPRWRFAIGASAATTFLAACLAIRVAPGDYVILAWWAVALAVFELGSLGLPSELRLCFVPMASIATALTLVDPGNFTKHPATPIWVTYFGMCLACAAAAARLTLRPSPDTTAAERTVLRDAMTTLACVAGLIAVRMVAPDPVVTIVWIAIPVALLEAAIALRVESFRHIARAALLPAYVRALAFDYGHVGLPLVASVIAIAGIYWMWDRGARASDGLFLQRLSRFHFWAALLPVIFVIWREAGSHGAPLGWAVVAIVFLVAGGANGLKDALWQSYGMAGLSFFAALWLDVDPPRLWICGCTAALLYVGQYLSKHFSAMTSRRVPIYFSLLATILLAALLYGDSSGGLLTISWGFQGLALLGCGFLFRERVLRLQGLALLLVCILKLFVYDLRNLETVYRIVSFVILGLILLGVSWIYSQFRENIRRLL